MNFLKNHKSYLYILTVLCCIAAAVIAKALFVSNFITQVTGVPISGMPLILEHDGFIFVAILVLFYLSLLHKIKAPFDYLFRLAAMFIFALYVIDYAVIKNFNVRLALQDIFKYGDNIDYMLKLYGHVIFLSCGIGLLILISDLKTRSKAVHSVFLSCILFFSGCALHNQDTKYVHSWLYQDFVSYNYGIRSELRAYSDDFIKRQNFKDEKICQKQGAEHPNIILLMVESLSSYHSAFFSGVNDWTPELDQLAQQNVALVNMYANGFVTEDGEISLLKGLPPLYPPQYSFDHGGRFFQGFFGRQNSLPNHLHKQGYHSAFITTAPLDFSDTGPWAESIGFDYVEGGESPFYNGWPRFVLRSAPDRALYERVLKYTQHDLDLSAPYFLFLKTVSSHQPYYYPEDGQRSEQKTIQYVDQQIGWFYRQLMAQKFFDDGILIVLGDHRAMTPVSRAESDKFGALQAAAKIPAVIIGQGFRAERDDAPFQQVDIHNGLVNLTGAESCYSAWVGDALNTPRKSADYIIHRRGDRRDLLSIFTSDGDHEVKLDGDETRLIGEGDDVLTGLVDHINYWRTAPFLSRKLAAK